MNYAIQGLHLIGYQCNNFTFIALFQVSALFHFSALCLGLIDMHVHELSSVSQWNHMHLGEPSHFLSESFTVIWGGTEYSKAFQELCLKKTNPSSDLFSDLWKLYNKKQQTLIGNSS